MLAVCMQPMLRIVLKLTLGVWRSGVYRALQGQEKTTNIYSPPSARVESLGSPINAPTVSLIKMILKGVFHKCNNSVLGERSFILPF